MPILRRVRVRARSTLEGVKVSLGPIQQTSLIPLYGRALDARKKRPISADPWAARIVDQLDWDFARLDGSHALTGSPIRSVVFDELVRRSLPDDGPVTVVDLGVGLNTRAQRMNLPDRVRFVEVDLPDVIGVRRQVLPASPNRELCEGSMLDEPWMHRVASRGGRFVLVAEAVFMYFDESDVHDSFARLARAFPGAPLVFDTFGQRMLDRQDRDKALAQMQARLRWACEDVHVVERWGGYRVEHTRPMLDLDDVAKGRVPLARRLGLRAFVTLMPKLAGSYRIHRVRMPAR